ncbi:hypothetical protein FRB93_002067 [Tulasnella sp. JGI-2019a]|nr:hypothetical protein FRB93_002067 [Tulasnella sp. JGI-2019a]
MASSSSNNDIGSPLDLSFTGSDGAECERFVQAIRKQAFIAGKQRDEEWMADLAACSMTADALRWHVSLPEDITSKWKNLQSALLSRYATSAEKTSGAAVPPAAAPPGYGTSSRLPIDPRGCKLRMGVVRVATPELASATYVCEELDSNGRLTLTENLNDALPVCFAPSKHPHNIHIPRVFTRGGHRLTRFTLLGVTNNSESGWYAITCTSPAADGSKQATSYAWPNETKSAVWNVSANNNISITWNNTGDA